MNGSKQQRVQQGQYKPFAHLPPNHSAAQVRSFSFQSRSLLLPSIPLPSSPAVALPCQHPSQAPAQHAPLTTAAAQHACQHHQWHLDAAGMTHEQQASRREQHEHQALHCTSWRQTESANMRLASINNQPLSDPSSPITSPPVPSLYKHCAGAGTSTARNTKLRSHTPTPF